MKKYEKYKTDLDAYKAAGEAEKEEMEKHAPCCNKPPSEPYCVDTDVPLVGCGWPVEKNPVWHMELALDVHLETACRLERDVLEALLAAPDLKSRDSRLRKLLGIPTDFCFSAIPCTPGVKMNLPKDYWTKKEYRLNVLLDYPLGDTYCFKVPITITRAGLYVGHMVWAVCMAYRLAYLAPRIHGVWGHALADLVLQGILIDIKNLILYPTVGS